MSRTGRPRLPLSASLTLFAVLAGTHVTHAARPGSRASGEACRDHRPTYRAPPAPRPPRSSDPTQSSKQQKALRVAPGCACAYAGTPCWLTDSHMNLIPPKVLNTPNLRHALCLACASAEAPNGTGPTSSSPLTTLALGSPYSMQHPHAIPVKPVDHKKSAKRAAGRDDVIDAEPNFEPTERDRA